MTNLLSGKSTLLIILIIFFVGFFLRFYQLSKIPNGFHIDEAISGVNGYFLSQTGRDSNNNKFPLQTEVFGDYNPTGYAYLTMLPIKLFGLNEFSTRFPGALLGGLTILSSFLLAFSIFKNKKIGLVSALLVAISPWGVVFSRSSEETLISIFFVTFGFALVFLSQENKGLKLLIPGILLLAISFFMYFTPRVFVPLIFLLIIICVPSFWHKQKKSYRNTLLFSLLLLGLIAFFLIFITKGGENRLNQVSIFGSPGTRLVMEEQIREDGVMRTPVKITQLFHNKIVNYFTVYTINYFDYFSGNFLFTRGGLPAWLSIDGIGMLYFTELPFLLIGLIVLSVSKNRFYKIPLLWIVTAPMIAAITMDDIPNMRRSLLMFPMMNIISAFGLMFVLQNRKKLLNVIIIFIAGSLFAFNFVYFLHQYFVHAPIHRNWYRNEGFDQMVKTINNSYNNVDKVIVTKSLGGIYPFILFYTKYDPKIYLSEGILKDKDYSGFGKFIFVPEGCPSVELMNTSEGKMLYVDNADCPMDKAIAAKKYDYVYRKDGTKVFRIVYD